MSEAECIDRGRIEAGLLSVRERISQAASRACRAVDSITLVAVSKTHPKEVIEVAYSLGHRAFGENYVQELHQKWQTLTHLEGLRLHFIGHLQRNKARQVVETGALVETVDSERVARELSKRALSAGVRLPVFLQVNIGRETQKAGCSPEKVPVLVEALSGLEGLDLRGLMAIPPNADDPEETRPHFRALKGLADAQGLTEVSMGMSQDFEVAIEEGATVVRVGTAIFGPRRKT